jgi:ankyrin repeat protein
MTSHTALSSNLFQLVSILVFGVAVGSPAHSDKTKLAECPPEISAMDDPLHWLLLSQQIDEFLEFQLQVDQLSTKTSGQAAFATNGFLEKHASIYDIHNIFLTYQMRHPNVSDRDFHKAILTSYATAKLNFQIPELEYLATIIRDSKDLVVNNQFFTSDISNSWFRTRKRFEVRSNWNFLQTVVFLGDINFFRRISSPPNVFVIDCWGRNLLHLSAMAHTISPRRSRQDALTVTGKLLEIGISTNLADKFGYTPLDYSSGTEMAELFSLHGHNLSRPQDSYFLSNGMQNLRSNSNGIDVKKHFLASPLKSLIDSTTAPVVLEDFVRTLARRPDRFASTVLMYLLQNELNIDSQNGSGDTALLISVKIPNHKMSVKDREEFVKLLVSAGANTEVRNFAGINAKEAAIDGVAEWLE